MFTRAVEIAKAEMFALVRCQGLLSWRPLVSGLPAIASIGR